MIEIKKQSGAVLVLALVLLTVLTLIGVTSMSTSQLELRIAGNSKLHHIAFQGAQSRLAYVTDQGSLTVPGFPVNFKIPIPDLDNPPIQDCNEPACPPDVNGTWTVTAEVHFVGCGKVDGSSLESGKSFSYRFFNIIAEGESSVGGIAGHSVQAQGVRFPVAGCEEET